MGTAIVQSPRSNWTFLPAPYPADETRMSLRSDVAAGSGRCILEGLTAAAIPCQAMQLHVVAR